MRTGSHVIRTSYHRVTARFLHSGRKPLILIEGTQ